MRKRHFFFMVTMASLASNALHADQVTSADYFGEPMPGLSSGQIQEFYKGMQIFTHFFGHDDGLGPLFNEHSCATCHAIPLAGGAGLARSTFVQLKPDHVNTTGGRSLAKFRITGDGLTVSQIDKTLELRRPPSLHGLGLLEAIPKSTILDNVDPEDANNDGISGRDGGVDGVLGIFGWKASVGSITEFNAQALINEHGITSHVYPEDGGGSGAAEMSESEMKSLDAFVRFLASPPALSRDDPAIIDGEALFRDIGCAACHVPSYAISDFEVEALTGAKIFPYTDLLLHDMGPELSDGVAEGAATSAEFRTPPLWGLKYLGPPYLHDGRAKSLDDAIRMHGGEAAQSSDAYKRLSPENAKVLLRFLQSI